MVQRPFARHAGKTVAACLTVKHALLPAFLPVAAASFRQTPACCACHQCNFLRALRHLSDPLPGSRLQPAWASRWEPLSLTP